MNRGVNALVWATNAKGITPTAFRVLVNLCSYVNGSDPKRNDYSVWPSIADVSRDCEISESNTRRHIAELIGKGFIEKVAWKDDKGRTTTNTYNILVASQHHMPNGSTVRSGRLKGCQIDTLPDGGGCQPRQGEGVTGDRAALSLLTGAMNHRSEPLKGTTEDSPTPLTGSTPPQDLFSQNVAEQDDTPKPPLHEYVAAEWDKLRVDYPRIQRIQVWNDSRMNAVKARAREFIKSTRLPNDLYAVWDMMFAAIRGDEWLRGEAPASPRYPQPFSLGIDYILRAREFAKTLEKAATNELDHRATHDPRTGRAIGPVEQDGRDALARFRANREQRGGSGNSRRM